MTNRNLALGLAAQSVAALVPIVAPSLARAPGVSPILAHHEAGDLVAFGAAGERSAARLRADVARVAAVIPRQVADDHREILCVASDRYHFTVGLLAAWQRGHRVALPPNVQPDLLQSMADGPAISLVIHDTDELTGLDLRPLLAEEARATPVDAADLAPLPAARGLVSVWTSGSTGEHQPHRKTAGQLFAEALVLAEHFGLATGRADAAGTKAAGAPERRGVRVAATVPSHHIYGLLFSVLVPLVSGGAFLRETPLHAGVVKAALEDTQADVLVSVPAHLRALRILDPGQLPALMRVFSSGAALPAATARMLFGRFGLEVTEVLGSTETGGMASRLSGAQREPALWEPLPHVQIDVGPEGRLLIDSPFLPPDGPRPWVTADRVELVGREGGREGARDGGDGERRRFRHLGRIDGVVKVGAKRVALAEIERRLFEIEGVEDAAVTVVEVEGARGRETVGLVVAPGLSPEHLRRELRRWLDPVVVPRRLRLLDALPREPNGKLTRKAMLAELGQTKARVRTLSCVRVASRGSDQADYAVYVPRDLYPLRGHFSSFPLVPGVVELELARAEARACWSDLGPLRRVLRLKFVRPLRPGEHLHLRLTRRGSKVDFCLFTAVDDTVGVGQLEFA